MARPLRLEVPGGTYHVTARGNAGEDIYRDDADRRSFLRSLAQARERFAWRYLAYCLMGNHYHLVVETPRANLARGMRQLNGGYAQRFNHRHNRRGHVFQSRYHAVLVERDKHMLELARYVALNPVRAGLCRRPEHWAWSSHRALLGLEVAGLVDVGTLLSHFGDAGVVSRQRYRAFVDDASADDDEPPDAIAGSRDFVEAHLPRTRPSPEIARRQWQSVRPPLDELLTQSERDEAIARAYRDFGYRMHEIARALGCHYATVSRRLRAWEARQMSECKT